MKTKHYLHEALNLMDQTDRSPKRLIRPLLYKALSQCDQDQKDNEQNELKLMKVFLMIARYESENSYSIEDLLKDLKNERKILLDNKVA